MVRNIKHCSFKSLYKINLTGFKKAEERKMRGCKKRGCLI